MTNHEKLHLKQRVKLITPDLADKAKGLKVGDKGIVVGINGRIVHVKFNNGIRWALDRYQLEPVRRK